MQLDILGWTLLVSVAANLIFFVIAFLVKSDKFTDITYASTFAIINLFSFFFNQNDFSIIKIFVICIVCLWSIRLGTYLLIRIFKTKNDSRFDNIRNNFWKFLGFWIIQALTAYIVSIPTIMLLATPIILIDPNLNYLSILVIIPICFLSYETVADIQKYKYFNLVQRPDFLKTGLYKYSRFPNYFAELSFWYSLCLIQFLFIFINKDFQNIDLLYLINILSPTYLMLTVIYLSGIKILDIKSIKKNKDNKEFQAYVKSTSMVIPFIGKKDFLSLAKKYID